MNVTEYIAAKFGKECNPFSGKAEVVNLDEYQKGWVVGASAIEQQSGSHRIRTEYGVRGNPQKGTPEDIAFTDWKRGYFVGLFSRISRELDIHMGVKV